MKTLKRRNVILCITLLFCLTGATHEATAQSCVSYQVFDRTVSKLSVDGWARGVKVVGNKLYVADSAGLTIFDATKPEKPCVVGRAKFSVGGMPFCLEVSGNFAYVGRLSDDNSSDLVIVEISNPEQPYEKTTINTDLRPSDIEIRGSYAFVSEMALRGQPTGGILAIYDIADPTMPALVGSTSVSTLATGVALAGDYAYMSDLFGLNVLDISTPSNPLVIDFLPTSEMATGAETTANHLFVRVYNRGLLSYDLTNPASPVLDNEVELPDAMNTNAANLAHMFYRDGTMYCTSGGTLGLSLIDVSVPSAMVYLHNVGTPGQASDVALIGTYAYVPTGEPATVAVLDLSHSEVAPVLGRLSPGGVLFDVTVANNVACFANPYEGLKIVDINRPSSPILLATVPSIRGMYVGSFGNTVFAQSETGDFSVIDVSDPRNPRVVGTLSLGTGFGDVAAGPRTAAIITGTNITVIDTSVPTAPVLAATLAVGGSPQGLVMSGGNLYVTNEDGLVVVSLTNAYAPQILGSVATPGTATKVDVVGNFAYVTEMEEGLRIIDVSQPNQPVLRGGVDTLYKAWDVFVDGSYAYVTHFNSPCVEIISVEHPNVPYPLASLSTLHMAFATFIHDGQIVIADGLAGCQISGVQCPSLSPYGKSRVVPEVSDRISVYPNPFNPNTTLSFSLARSGFADLRIYDARGAQVRVLVSEELSTGDHLYKWNGVSDNGARVPSGVYLYKLVTPEGMVCDRMTLLK